MKIMKFCKKNGVEGVPRAHKMTKVIMHIWTVHLITLNSTSLLSSQAALSAPYVSGVLIRKRRIHLILEGCSEAPIRSYKSYYSSSTIGVVLAPHKLPGWTQHKVLVFDL